MFDLDAYLERIGLELRIVARNAVGEATSSVQTFTTAPSSTPALAQPITPVLVVTPTLLEAKETGPSKPTTKTLTKAQKLAKALKACKSKPKSKRASCEKQARKQFGPAKRKKKA